MPSSARQQSQRRVWLRRGRPPQPPLRMGRATECCMTGPTFACPARCRSWRLLSCPKSWGSPATLICVVAWLTVGRMGFFYFVNTPLCGSSACSSSSGVWRTRSAFPPDRERNSGQRSRLLLRLLSGVLQEASLDVSGRPPLPRAWLRDDFV